MIRFQVAIGFAASSMIACTPSDNAPGRKVVAPAAPAAVPALAAGEAYLNVPGGRIWYRKTGSADGTPVILLHGGPGYSSYYLKPLEALGSDRPLVRYDQLDQGGGDVGGDFSIGYTERERVNVAVASALTAIGVLGKINQRRTDPTPAPTPPPSSLPPV